MGRNQDLQKFSHLVIDATYMDFKNLWKLKFKSYDYVCIVFKLLNISMLELFTMSTTTGQHLWAESILLFLCCYIKLNTKYFLKATNGNNVYVGLTTKWRLYYTGDIIIFIHKIL